MCRRPTVGGIHPKPPNSLSGNAYPHTHQPMRERQRGDHKIQFCLNKFGPCVGLSACLPICRANR